MISHYRIAIVSLLQNMSDTTDSTPVTTTTRRLRRPRLRRPRPLRRSTSTTSSPLSEALIRQKIGSLLEGAPITNVIMMTRQNPTTGYDYQSARISVDWGECEKSDNDLGKIKKALEDGKQIKVDYDTRPGRRQADQGDYPKATTPYWILVKHEETVIPKPTYGCRLITRVRRVASRWRTIRTRASFRISTSTMSLHGPTTR